MKFFYLIFVINIFVFDLTHALNDNCTKNEDCSIKEKSVCIDKICQCNALSQYNEAQEKCLSYATEYNTLCYEDWQCKDFIGDNSECSNNACLCASGYRWFRGKCQKYAKKGETCSSDVICLDVNTPLGLTCVKNICECSEGYYDREGDCRVKSLLGGECAITEDCFPTKNMFDVWTYSHCELGKCIKNTADEKPKSKDFNNTFKYSEFSSFLKEVMDENLDDATTASADTKCANGVSSDLSKEDCLKCSNTIYFKDTTCVCKPGFFLQDGKCLAELGVQDPDTHYASDKECPIKPGKAVNGVCYCKDYWFQGSTNRECKKTTLEYTKNCLDNDWCKAMGPYAFCNSETEKCQCSSQAVLNETSFYCELKPDADLTNICFENSACPLYETCTDESCQCDEGFFRVEKAGLCLPEIGYSCEVRNCSHIDNAICFTNETCQCENDEWVSDGFVCLETVPNLNDDCEIEQQCKNIPHADCKVLTTDNATTQCLCTDEFLDVDGACYAIKTPGSQCTTKFNCTVILGNTFECRNSLCQCPIGTELNTEQVCVSGSDNQNLLHPIVPIFLTILVACLA